MLNQIKALLSDAQLRQKIKKASSPAEEIALIKTAGVAKGYYFSSDSISKLIESQLEPLSEQDLLVVAGGGEDTNHRACVSVPDGGCWE